MAIQWAAFPAATSQYSGDWLFALPTASCELRLDDEAVRIAIRVRLGLQLCTPNRCHCGAQVDAHGRLSFICKRAPGRTIPYHHLNELIARALPTASIPNTKELQDLCRSDGKRPDGLTLVPWQSGKPLIWDVTVVSYVALAARDKSATAEMAASNKTAKYAGLTSDYHFQPITVESLGPANESAIHFLTVLGKKIAQQTGYERETAFLFQRLSILVQRFNCVLLHDSFVHDDCPD